MLKYAFSAKWSIRKPIKNMFKAPSRKFISIYDQARISFLIKSKRRSSLKITISKALILLVAKQIHHITYRESALEKKHFRNFRLFNAISTISFLLLFFL
jgi:hypothetical protein